MNTRNVIFSFAIALLCTSAFAQEPRQKPEGAPPLVDGAVNPELIDDSIALDVFANMVLSYEERSDLNSNDLLNSMLDTTGVDYSDVVTLLTQYVDSKETLRADNLWRVCTDARRGRYPSSSELARNIAAQEETAALQSQDNLFSEIAQQRGDETQQKLTAAINKKIKSGMKIRLEVNVSDFSDEQLNKLDRNYILTSSCPK